MINWFNKSIKKDYPDFYNSYLEKFEADNPKTYQEAVFIILDTETTGFDYKKDRILSIGAVVLENMQIVISKSLEVYVTQNRFNPDTVEIHGLLRNEKLNRLSELEAIKIFLEYIGNSIIVAHHAKFDITMINNALKRQGLPKLKNRILDTVDLHRRTLIKSNLIDTQKNFTLDELAYFYDIDLSDRHTAAGDAYITALIFLRTISKLKSGKNLQLDNLFKKSR
ncbi:DNA polymerase-3 subunit epsilon [Flavobacteriaceae bacterium MAR_2010_188]|nr:DNA polymerase-3 subunit epsilon [Flavobacteriaceae bacterium MAR_2010_188]